MAKKEIREVLNTLCCIAMGKDLSKSPTGFDDEVDGVMLELHELGVAIVRYPVEFEDLTGCVIVRLESLMEE